MNEVTVIGFLCGLCFAAGLVAGVAAVRGRDWNRLKEQYVSLGFCERCGRGAGINTATGLCGDCEEKQAMERHWAAMNKTHTRNLMDHPSTGEQ